MKARSGNDVVEIKLSMFHRSPGRDCERDRNKAHDADYWRHLAQSCDLQLSSISESDSSRFLQLRIQEFSSIVLNSKSSYFPIQSGSTRTQAWDPRARVFIQPKSLEAVQTHFAPSSQAAEQNLR